MAALSGPDRRVTFGVADPTHPEWRYLGKEGAALVAIAALHPDAYDRVVCLGTDVYDGSYSLASNALMSTLAQAFAARGKPAAVVGISMRPKIHDAVRQNIARLHRRVRFTVRDPISFARFIEHCPGAAPLLTADPAFLLEAQPAPAEVEAWIRERKARGRRCFGVNVNRHFGADADRLAARVLSLMQATTNACFVLIPHDARAGPGDVAACHRLMALAPAGLKADVLALPVLEARQIKGVCRQLDAVLTCRMHLAIAALSQGVPALAIDYNFKMKGLYSYFGLQELVVGMEGAPRSWAALIDALDAVRASIRSRSERLRWLAGRNFERETPRDKCSLYDQARYDAWSVAPHKPKWPNPVAPGQPLSEDNWRALLAIDSHRVEKGLALKAPRKDFGQGTNLLARLLANLEAYLSRHGLDATAGAAIASLRAYDDFSPALHLAAQLDGLLRRRAGIASTGDDREATLSMSRQEMLRRSMRDLEEFFASRSSVRNFSPEPVAQQLIERAVAMAHHGAPSVCNRQPYRVRVFAGERKGPLLELQNGNRGFGEQLDKLLVVSVDTQYFEKFEERNQPWIAGGLFSMSLLYALHSLGVAACPLNWDVPPLTDSLLRERAAIADSEVVIMMIGAGHYPEQFRVARSRRLPLEQIVTFVG